MAESNSAAKPAAVNGSQRVVITEIRLSLKNREAVLDTDRHEAERVGHWRRWQLAGENCLQRLNTTSPIQLLRAHVAGPFRKPLAHLALLRPPMGECLFGVHRTGLG